jgi:HAD superfamily hydrolase (TIGR01484 family)
MMRAMRYFALATDYDGTLAHDGRVNEPTLDALLRMKERGRKLVLVTGRELEDLATVFDRFDLFDICVLENGALLYWPKTRTQKVLAERPPERFAELLRERGVDRISQGRVIVATWHPHETTVLSAIRDLGLELEVIFNKQAVMVLPTGVNKATGLVAGLKELGLSPRNTVGIGDAENDHAFLAISECSVAVSNSVPMLKERADIVTAADHGAGVVELIEEMLAGDLAGRDAALLRRRTLVGYRLDGRQVRIPQLHNIAILGAPGSGKKTAAAGFLEQLIDAGYQCCLADPQGEYASLEDITSIGTADQPPPVEDVLDLLRRPEQQVEANLVAAAGEKGPEYFGQLLAALMDMRRRLGRPHWIFVDEAHQLAPTGDGGVLERLLPGRPSGLVISTPFPDKVAPPLLTITDTVIAMGPTAPEMLSLYARVINVPPPPRLPESRPYAGEALVWERRGEDPYLMRILTPREERRRHRRRPTEIQLAPEQSFYFRGPDNRLKLRAQNLAIFLQLADGVDDDTWNFHLHRADYSRWVADHLRDHALAEEIAAVERQDGHDAAQSRAAVRRAIQARSTTAI